MTKSTQIKRAINRVLRPANIRIETLTADNIEADRIQRQFTAGQFSGPVFPLLEGMASFDGKHLADTYIACAEKIDLMMQGAHQRSSIATTPSTVHPTPKFYI